MANRLDIVAVRANHERGMVIRMVVRAQTRCTVVLATGLQGCTVKSVNLLATAGHKRQVQVPRFFFSFSWMIACNDLLAIDFHALLLAKSLTPNHTCTKSGFAGADAFFVRRSRAIVGAQFEVQRLRSIFWSSAMPFYECPDCQSVVELPTLSAKARGKCRCCGCGDITARCLDPHSTEELDLSGNDTTPVKAKRLKPSIVGRMGAAPPLSTWPLLPPLTLNADVTYVKDLTLVAWTGSAATCVRLPYQYLDKKNPNMQGLVISLPGLAADPVALLHFQQCTQQMLTTNKSTDVTEATGEVAAAMAMIKHYPAFKMQWGLHCHKGAGIDQIWTLCDVTGTLTEVMIVEAKGPGAGLSGNPNMPPNFDQMGKNWIIHNLATMMSGAKGGVSATAIHQGTLAQSIVTGLGLTVGTTYPMYNGASKSYYGVVSATGAKTVKVRRLLVTARWQNDGLLSFDMVLMGSLKAFVPTDGRFHATVHNRYPSLVPSVVPQISYP